MAESDAKRGAFEISTCLYKWLTLVDKLKTATVLLLFSSSEPQLGGGYNASVCTDTVITLKTFT